MRYSRKHCGDDKTWTTKVYIVDEHKIHDTSVCIFICIIFFQTKNGTHMVKLEKIDFTDIITRNNKNGTNLKSKNYSTGFLFANNSAITPAIPPGPAEAAGAFFAAPPAPPGGGGSFFPGVGIAGIFFAAGFGAGVGTGVVSVGVVVVAATGSTGFLFANSSAITPVIPPPPPPPPDIGLFFGAGEGAADFVGTGGSFF